nr:unnamed protein product [Spirometra erinaceieuropaei]
MQLAEFQSLWPQLDLIIDGGRIIADEGADPDSGNQNASRAGSTVVDLSECVRSPGSNLYTIVREGSALIQTEKILARFGLRRSTPT